MWIVKEEEGVIATGVIPSKVYAVDVHMSRRHGK